ncbi:Bifunctional uridylyltransferase/uridylyl-removing enzyme [BD1-7 clade bacterium]|uniref:Bifunctional uridylyltransferase/uridylyl-removing enzyme n=1 Tax=BD1-7 clade bacterium TaxID=2029982 RepID=A0A5S9QE44_9GAMM|nr:Bifunctional uridylyltransferase/uridylyl-removing enzyme [BD1-7 clade bacterium]
MGMSLLPVQSRHQKFDSAAGLLSFFKQSIDDTRKKLYDRFQANPDTVEELILARSLTMDELLAISWQFFIGNQAGLSLIAVGGYGREELLPYSDIDVLILGSETAFESQKDSLENYITFLWDTGLDIGHSVRTAQECQEQARNDITIATNLMESRVLCGDPSLHDELLPLIAPEAIWPSREFFKAKWDEQIGRHKRVNNTEYNLEPNVKNSPGGLRDIQMIGWVAKRHFDSTQLDELVEHGFMAAEEFYIMKSGRTFLHQVRFALHMLAGREEDRLMFEHQRKIAELLGYEDNPDSLGIEQMMKQYYRWVLALSELNDMLMQLFDEQILRACDAEEIMEINPRFRIRNRQIEVTNERVFQQNPSALLEMFTLMAKHDNIEGVRAQTIRLIRENRHLIDDEFRQEPRNKQLFLELVRSPRRVASMIKLMKRYGVLGKYIPAFGQIIGQTQLDLFHIYTVDAHTIMVLKNMRRFTYEDMRERFPIANQVMRRIEHKDLLYIACLFHDIAKGRGGDHSTLGADDAFEFCREHGFNYRDSNMAAWLVKYHLLMSHTAQKKDLTDPEVIRKFAQKVGDMDHLDNLFVLTVADINGTNPELWNSWRASLIRQLYYETKRVLRRGIGNAINREDSVIETQTVAKEKLIDDGVTEASIETIWANAGDDYFLRETPNDIVWHTQAIAAHQTADKPLVLMRQAPNLIFNGASQIFVYTRDRVHTFAIVAAVLEQLFLNIVDAKVYSSQSGYTLDTFMVLDGNGEPLELLDNQTDRIVEALEEKLTEEHDDLISLVKRRTPRQLKFFSLPTHTLMMHDDTKGHSILEVTTADRPGLLAIIGEIFVEFGIELINAKIATLGEKVEDIFFITDTHNQPILDEELCQAIQDEICRRLDLQVAEAS